ncbi:MAG: hypothetical protein QS748_12605 [Candidatus Endonucleobacter bathymodioli]|uniref:Uncharacterized protein n=1 Tax=Candidatus Endonucleibacter bathymodioli TaxID=539814 RepID=A0AA90NNQ3_9GAMM|nr:hypothetical protein [Candidatus Endonucleobacter bathymodioli]
MNRLIKIVCFLCVTICFGPLSYGKGDPEIFEDINEQLGRIAYSAGERTFNKLAFGVDDDNVTSIKSWMKENGRWQKDEVDSHCNEISADFIVFVCDGEMRYLELLLLSGEHKFIKRVNKKCKDNIHDYGSAACERMDSDLGKTHDYIMTASLQDKIGVKCSTEIYEIINKIAGNMSKHTGKKYMKIKLYFHQDCSDHKVALNWHRDWWDGRRRNPDFLAFAVLDMILPTERLVSSHAKIALGLIDENHEYLYTASRGGLTMSPSYEPEYRFRQKTDSELRSIRIKTKSCVQPLKELSNFTGSGYIVDQTMVIHDGKKIVHSRQKREYDSERLSMIIRCVIACDESDMHRSLGYKKSRD